MSAREASAGHQVVDALGARVPGTDAAGGADLLDRHPGGRGHRRSAGVGLGHRQHVGEIVAGLAEAGRVRCCGPGRRTRSGRRSGSAHAGGSPPRATAGRGIAPRADRPGRSAARRGAAGPAARRSCPRHWRGSSRSAAHRSPRAQPAAGIRSRPPPRRLRRAPRRRSRVPPLGAERRHRREDRAGRVLQQRRPGAIARPRRLDLGPAGDGLVDQIPSRSAARARAVASARRRASLFEQVRQIGRGQLECGEMIVAGLEQRLHLVERGQGARALPRLVEVSGEGLADVGQDAGSRR